VLGRRDAGDLFVLAEGALGRLQVAAHLRIQTRLLSQVGEAQVLQTNVNDLTLRSAAREGNKRPSLKVQTASLNL